jgi:glycine betaine/proline transport system permease protein
MQTMPAFGYLVPMVVFLGLGEGLVATVVFAAPPAVSAVSFQIAI